MKTMDIKVYGRYRKHPYVPDYQVDINQPFVLIRNVPIFLVTAEQLDAVIGLEDLEQIHLHCQRKLIILTDRRRVLAVEPQGYDYARYVHVIDVESAQTILNMR